jgi:molybdopterin-dependent oxidoreductase alpha subunit
MKRPRSGGGWPAILYTLRMARRAGGLLRLYRALRRPNACKTCALGMGGQRGGMVNEAGRFPEVCKKSMQAMAADMQAPIAPRFFEQLTFDALRRLTPRELEHMGRLATPLYAGPDDDRYRAIPWERALGFCAERLAAARPRPDENYFYFSGRSSNEAAFLWQLFARLYGTNNVNNCSYYCHQASGVGLSSAVGGGTATVTLDDLEHCDLVFLIGGNPASNHPRLMATLADVRRRGGNVVVVNPLREAGLVNFRIPSRPLSLLLGSKIASLYVQPNIGGDIALLTGVAKRLFEMNAYDPRAYQQFERPSPADVEASDQQRPPGLAPHDFDFLGALFEGYWPFREHVERTAWDEITRASGVDGAVIDRVAALYAASRATVFAWTMGITHHEHGVDNVRAIANLALLRGMVGRPHAGLLPIRGHSNVQGVGSMGVTPKLRDAVFERLQTHFGVKLPTTPGLDTLSCVEAMQAGTVRHAWCLGGNLFGSNPDAQATAAAFGRLDSVAYLSTTLNTGHAWGRARHTLILPVKARDEELQPTTQESMFNYVRLSDGGPPRIPQARGEVEIVAELARRVLGEAGPVDWRAMEQHRTVRAAIAAVIPGFESIGRIDETRREFHIDGRTLHAPRFSTASGKARFHVTRIPQLRLEGGELRLMTIRSEGQFNTVVYEEEDVYRGQERRDVILMNAADIARLGLRADQPVTVRGPAGERRGVLVRACDIPPGNAAMYYPEANVLIPRVADPESRTPAFKSVRVTLAPAEGLALPIAGTSAPGRRGRRRESRAC